MRWSVLLGIALVVLSACAAAVTESDEYLELSTEVEQLETQLIDLEAQYATTEQLRAEISQSQARVAEAQTEVDALEAEKQELTDFAAMGESVLAALNAEKNEVDVYLDALSHDMTAAMLSNASFEKAVEAYADDLDRWDCALDIQGVFAGLGGTAVKADQLADRASDALLDMGMDAFGLPNPQGCPSWYFSDDAGYWSDSKITDEMCETVDVDRLSRRPEEFKGKCVTGWGNIVQFDYNTGPCAMHADIGPRNTAWYNYELRVELKDTSGSCSWLDDIGQGDEIRWWAVGDGVLTYDTTAGGSNTIPTLNIFTWQN